MIDYEASHSNPFTNMPRLLTQQNGKMGMRILVFVVVYPLLRFGLTQYIQNPVIPRGGVLALDMALPLIAGILFGGYVGLTVGFFGPGITCLCALIFKSSFNYMFLLGAIPPLAVAGYVSGILARKYSLLVSSFLIFPVHFLSLGIFYCFGLLSPSEMFSQPILLGLTGESMVDIVIINLVCILYWWFVSKHERVLPRLRVDYILVTIVALTALSVVITIWRFPWEVNHLFLGYIAILLSTIFYGRITGLVTSLLFIPQGLFIIIGIRGAVGPFEVPEEMNSAFLHTSFFGVLALVTSELVESRRRVIEENILLRTEKMRVEKEEEERRNFINALAHEIKTPLTSIVGSAGLLSEDVEDQSFVRRVVKNIYQASQDMDRRISELLDSIRVRKKGFEIHRTALDLRSLLKEVGSHFRLPAQDKRQSLVLDLPPSLPAVWGDRARIKQVVQNLLSNAVKFCPPGGRIVLKAKDEGDTIKVKVENTGGIGIPREVKERLFEPYFRLNEHEHVPGVGLGLYLSRRLVELHGGKMEVEGESGKVTTFSFFLPKGVEDEGTSD